MQCNYLRILLLGLAWLVADPVSGRADAPMSNSPLLDEATSADSVLAQIPTAQRTIVDWADAAGILRENSLDVQAAMLRVSRAEGESRAALAKVLPSLNGFAIYTRSNQTTVLSANPALSQYSDALSVGGVLDQTLIDFRAWHAVGTAHVNDDAQQLSLADLKRRLTMDTATAIVAVLSAERIAEISRIGFRSALDQLRLTASRLRGGTATELDVKRAEQDAVAARAAIIVADEAVYAAREALGLAFGLAEPVGVRGDLRVSDLVRTVLSSCKSIDDYHARTDLLALARLRQAAERRVSEGWMEYLPTLSLHGAMSSTSLRDSSNADVLWSAQLALNLPIWDGGARSASYRLARVDVNLARLAYESSKRKISVQMVQLQRQVQVAESNKVAAEQMRDLTSAAMSMTQDTFRAGRSTSLELVVAAAAARQAELTLALRQFELVRAQLLADLSMAECRL